MKAFEEKAKRYVAEKDFSARANAELSLYNLKMKLNRLELLQYQLDLEMVALSNNEHKLTEKFLHESYVNELRAQSGLLGKSVLSAEQMKQTAEAVLNTPFKGRTWSNRIWQRQDVLRQIVARMTEECLLKGKHPTTMIGQLRKEFDVSASEATRLAVTEGARMATEATRQAILSNGYDGFEYIAEPSACPICKRLNGKVFKVSDMEIGVNAPPMHPYCHCAIASHDMLSDDEYEALIRESAESRKGIESGSEKVYNQGMEGLQRKKSIDQNKMSVASQEQINRLSRKFRRRGGEFVSDDDAIKYLDENGAEAITLDAYTIVKRKLISISALIEELEHAEQYLRGENDGTALSVAINEIRAKEKSISEQERYRLPKIEVESVQRDIEFYQKEIERLKNENSKF